MGQLEKYGLYVLCLVIFLILGVTIWGNPDSPSPQQKNEVVPMRVNAGGTSLTGGDVIPVGNRQASPENPRAAGNSLGMLQTLLKPAPRTTPKPVSRPSGATPKPVSNPVAGNSGTSNPGGGNASGGSTTKPAPVKPAPVAATRKYTVKKGDILGRIAQKQLGSIRHVGRIRDLNKGLTDNLKIGQVLILPARASGNSGTAAPASSSAFRTYTISKGDTFERIARLELKSAARSREIQQLNRNVNPLRLIPGKTIKLPIK